MAKKSPPKSIFIACEGSNTEPIYLERLIETYEDDAHYPYAFTIYPNRIYDENPKTDAKGLVNIAIERQSDYDECWVVFDKDGYTLHEEVFQLAKAHNIHIAFSSIAIEYWILSHFERCQTPFKKSSDIITEKFLNKNKYLPDYVKNGEYNIYPYIYNYTENAYINNAYMEWFHQSLDVNFKPFEVNPYTNVNSLIKKISLDERIHLYSPLNEFILINKIKIQVSNYDDQLLTIEIVNSSSRAYVLNEFVIHDYKGIRIPITSKIIPVNENVRINFKNPYLKHPIFINFENHKIEIATSV